MQWSDDGYLLSKNNFDENSIIIDVFTLNHGRYSGIVYGGDSRKHRNIFQVGNKINLNWRSKSERKSGYFTAELIKSVAAPFLDDKKRSVCILSATSILKLLLPDRQVNKDIYNSFEYLLSQLNSKSWIKLYINWELSLLKFLGFDIGFLNNLNNQSTQIKVNNNYINKPKIYLNDYKDLEFNDNDILEALIFNKLLLQEFIINPSKLKFPLFRNLLEKYYN